MGKKVAQTKKSVADKKPKAAAQADAEPAQDHSIMVAQKMANDIKIKQHISAMNAKVIQKVDLKQVVSAAKALKAFAKKQSEALAEKSLLTDEDQTVHVTFTMTQVPTNPSPKPQMIKVDHPFLTEEQRSRVCVIVKDPVRAFKD